MPPGSDVVTLGGTVGLIAFLLITVWQFGTGKWRPGSDVEDANTRTLAAVKAGEIANAATAKALEENAAWRALVRQMLVQQGTQPPGEV